MKIPLFCRIFGLLVLSVSAPASADVPASLHHQGRIAVDGINFDGSGRFRFLLFHQGEAGSPITPVWKNDDATPAIAQPSSISGITNTQFRATLTLPVGLGTSGLGIEGSSAETSVTAVDGRPAIAFSGGANSTLHYAINSAADGSGTWTITEVDASVAAESKSLAVIGGKPAIAYRAGESQNELKFAISSNPDGSGVWATSSVEAGSTSHGLFASLAQVDGRPAISYLSHPGLLYLRFAINSAADGSGTWSFTSVDTDTTSNGFYSSLHVINGRPAISYQDRRNYDLRFAINTDTDGSGPWIRTTVDAPGNVGRYTSLSVVDGRPAISYEKTSDPQSLRFAINTSPDASGAWTISAVTGVTSPIATHLGVIAGAPAILCGSDRGLEIVTNSSPDGSGTWSRLTIDSNTFWQENASFAVLGEKPMAGFLGRQDAPGSLEPKIWIEPVVPFHWIAVGPGN